MIALAIEINGELRCTAGTSDLSVLNAIVGAVGKLGSDSRGAKGNEENFYIDVTVGGLTSRDSSEKDEHLDWIREPLAIGDSIAIRIVEVAEADAPAFTKVVKRESDEARYFKWAKNFYFAHREKYETT